MGDKTEKKAEKADKDWVEEQVVKADPRIARLQDENSRLSRLLGLVESYHSAAAKPPAWLLPKKTTKVGAATACLAFSDLHLDEVVEPAQVGGLNAFNREIAELRLRRWVEKACELGDRFRHKWDGAAIFWAGDSVSGSIHEELRETNADYLHGTLCFWAPKIASAFKAIADFYGSVHIPVVVGNHGRLTALMPCKGRAKNSWDWLLAQMVRSHLASDKRITWDIAEGSYLFVPIYDRHVYMTHGDEVKGGAGWAGVWSPLGTIQKRGVELGVAHGIRPTYMICGHWHQTVLAHQQGIACNGALKGFDEYASCKRFRPEPAAQNYWIETPERGVTMAAAMVPIVP